VKEILIGGILLMGWVVPGAGLAQTKVGYLDLIRVAEESPQYAAASKGLQQDLARREGDLRGKADQVKKLEERLLGRETSGMSESEAKKLEREISQKRRELKNSQDEYREEISLRKNEERGKLMRQVDEVVKELGKEEGFDLIITDGVAYHSGQVDISEKVLTRLKNKFGAR